MEKNKKQERKRQYDIETIHHSFTENLEGLGTFVGNLTPIVKEHDEVSLRKVKKAAIEKINRIVTQHQSELERNKKYKINLENLVSQMVDSLKDWPHFPPSEVLLLSKSSFIILTSYFDFLISDLIRWFHQTYPESLSGKEWSITLNELKLYDDVSEVIAHFVNKEVDKLGYDSLSNQKRYFKKYLRIDTKEHIIHWNKINEAKERRNIIVHNDSIVNRRYLENVDLSVIPEKTKDLKEGKKITINEDYLTTVFDEILIAGIILIQCCWRKWRKGDIDNADSQLIGDMHDALLKEKWPIAERLGLFSKECKVCNERNRLYLDIHYCQSLKWQNKKDELEKELKKFDMSTRSPIYILALCALKNDKGHFYKNVEKAIIVDKMEK